MLLCRFGPGGGGLRRKKGVGEDMGVEGVLGGAEWKEVVVGRDVVDDVLSRLSCWGTESGLVAPGFSYGVSWVADGSGMEFDLFALTLATSAPGEGTSSPGFFPGVIISSFSFSCLCFSSRSVTWTPSSLCKFANLSS